MNNIQHQHLCGAIPQHMLNRIASRCGPEASRYALATLDQMRQIAAARTLLPPAVKATAKTPQKNRRVYDAKHRRQTPGHLVRDERSAPTSDIVVNRAFDGTGSFYDFFWLVYGRSSVDGKGMRLDSTVHYGVKFENALWDGAQMIYGDGDGLIFEGFTNCPDIQGHEITHGHIQYLCGLGYTGQTGALNEHIADVFGMLFKQWLRNETAAQSDWLFGEGVYGPGVRGGRALRSFPAPGTAYDDPILGKDPQPAHMRDYVVTQEDNGGVHTNSGILNHAFYLFATTLGGYAWQVPGYIWFNTLAILQPDADFNDFALATMKVAGGKFGEGSYVQKTLAQSWALVGISVPLPGPTSVPAQQAASDSMPLAA
jgi:Zn-dependent metalloprotease